MRIVVQIVNLISDNILIESSSVYSIEKTAKVCEFY